MLCRLGLLLLMVVVPSMSFFSSQGGMCKMFNTRCFAGFGSAPEKVEQPTVAVTTCPCSSGLQYDACCGPFHKKSQQLPDATSLMRSRYSAYALGNIEYIIDTTSPTSPDYISYVESPVGARSGKKKWEKDIRKNMLDMFVYVKMEIDGTDTVEGDSDRMTVQYRHLAIKKTDNTMFPISETALCQKIDGQWLYSKSDVARPLPEQAKVMMEDWPVQAGLKLIGKNPDAQLLADGGNTESGDQLFPAQSAQSRQMRPRAPSPQRQMSLPPNAGKKR